MEIILNDKEYIAPKPMTKLWYDIQKMKTEQEQRASEIQDIWAKIEPYENVEQLDESIIEERDKNIIEASTKLKQDKLLTLESQIKIIVDAYRNSNVTFETIITPRIIIIYNKL